MGIASTLILAVCLMQSAQSPSESSLPEGSQVTLGYNLARVREAAGQLHAAAVEYRSILAQFPGYLGCSQRLSAIACKRGDFAAAERQLRDALKTCPNDPDTLACMGEGCPGTTACQCDHSAGWRHVE